MPRLTLASFQHGFFVRYALYLDDQEVFASYDKNFGYEEVFTFQARTCGHCDSTLRLEYLTDTKPTETFWSFRSDNDSDDYEDPCAVSEYGGPYMQPSSPFTKTVSTSLCLNENYTFSMTDYGFDGLEPPAG